MVICFIVGPENEGKGGEKVGNVIPNISYSGIFITDLFLTQSPHLPVEILEHHWRSAWKKCHLCSYLFLFSTDILAQHSDFEDFLFCFCFLSSRNVLFFSCRGPLFKLKFKNKQTALRQGY